MLTKEQRLAAYQYALEQLTTIGNQAVCNILQLWCGEEEIEYGDFLHEVSELFPEFYAQKPKNKHPIEYWWVDIKPRIKALQAAIKLIESQSTPGTTQMA